MAGLIPQSFIDDLLNRVDIVDVVDNRVQLKKTGKNYSACCPFHQEKTPSFSVQPEKQFYYCFGCGVGGNALGFVMNFEQLDFPQAVEMLAKENGMDVPREESKAATQRKSENAKLSEMLEKSSRFYQYQIRHHGARQAAVDYLKARGVSGEIAREFCLGYAPAGWDNLLTALGTDANQQQLLLKAGLVIEKEKLKDEAAESEAKSSTARRYYDRFRHRIIFPIRDSRGRTIAFGGRVLGDDKPKYLNSPETALFHKGSELYGLYECRKADSKARRILIVEGYMDVIALAQMGIRNAVATLGTATSTHHLSRLFRWVPEIVFCFDGDDAGRTAAWRALQATLPLMEDGRQVRFLLLPDGEDPDTLVRKIGKEEFSAKIDQATAMEDYFFQSLSKDLDITSIEGKARLSNLAKPLIKQFPKGVYGQLILDRLSETLGMSSQSLAELLATEPEPAAPVMEQAPPDRFQSEPPHFSQRTSSTEKLAKYRKPASLKAIELLLHNPEIALSITRDLQPLRSAEDENRKLLLSLIEMIQKDPTTDTYTMAGYCYGTTLGHQLPQLLQSEKITPVEGMEQEFTHIIDSILSDIFKKLELLELKDQLKSRVKTSKAQT